MLKRWNFLKTGFYEGINLELYKCTQIRHPVIRHLGLQVDECKGRSNNGPARRV